MGKSSVRENALPEKVVIHFKVLPLNIMTFLILNMCATLAHCLILTTWQFFCRNEKKAHNRVDTFVPVFIPFSKNDHRAAN